MSFPVRLTISIIGSTIRVLLWKVLVRLPMLSCLIVIVTVLTVSFTVRNRSVSLLRQQFRAAMF